MVRLAPTVLSGVLLESETPISRIRLMKLLFLIRHETIVAAAGAFYDFLPQKIRPLLLHRRSRPGGDDAQWNGDGL